MSCLYISVFSAPLKILSHIGQSLGGNLEEMIAVYGARRRRAPALIAVTRRPDTEGQRRAESSKPHAQQLGSEAGRKGNRYPSRVGDDESVPCTAPRNWGFRLRHEDLHLLMTIRPAGPSGFCVFTVSRDNESSNYSVARNPKFYCRLSARTIE